MVVHQLNKSLTGPQGYKRLARLIARAIYSGEVPPREEEPQEDGPTTSKGRLPKHTFEGLAILLLDYLASSKVEGYVDEMTIAADLRLSQKNIRRALRYLEGEHLVSSETVKLALKRQGLEVDDTEIEETMKRKETRVYWCMDYPRMKDTMQLRLHKIRELLRKHAAGADAIRNYVCPVCGSQYSSLDALRLLDMMTGTFRCEELSCRSELQEHTELEAGGQGADGSARERQAYFKGLLERLETQMKPIIEQLDRLKDVEAPDAGSLQDWYQAHRDEMEKRAKRLEAARKRAAANGPSMVDMTDDQLLEWAEKAEFHVALPDAEGGSVAESAQVQGKEVPVWFRGEAAASQPSIGPNASEEDQTAGTLSVEDQKRMLEQQYLQQYLQQVRRAGGGGDGAADEKSPAAKRVKVEHTTVTVTTTTTVEVKEEVKEEIKEVEWEDEDDGGAVAGDGAGAGEEDEWEDI